MSILTSRVARFALALLALAASTLVAGCGAGTAGIVAGSGSSGNVNSAPALADLQVPVSKTAPARIQVELSDREGESVRLELSARVPLAGGGLGAPELLTAVGGPGFPANGATVAIPGGSQPLALELEWRFPEESFLPNDGRFVEGVQLVARLANGAELVLGDDEPFSLGNDAPVVTDAGAVIDPQGEAAGIVRVVVTVADSSDDVVSVRPEFDLQGDVPDAGWQPATGFGLTDVRVARDGTTLDFFWDTDANLHDLEREVALRFTAEDQAQAVGAAFVSAPFRVDNNAAPIVQLLNDAVITNPDERRGIPIPFRVFDEEQDPVEVILQWRREGEGFPSLDTNGDGEISNAEMDAIQADPALRAEHHIATPFPRFARGHVVPVDATRVRLPELAQGEGWILAAGLEGRTLEILRPSSIPAAPAWSTNPLVNAVAALPLGDGLSALVLDAPGNGRLREIELATGAVVREIAAFGQGIPSALAAESAPAGEPFRPAAVLVALDDAGVWRIERVELASGATTALAVSDGSQPGPVRGLASLGTKAAIFTAGSVLFHLDYRDALAPQLGTLLSDLAVPWGVVVDPLPPGRLYLGEHDRNRVLAVELESHGRVPVVVKTATMQPASLDAPEALTLEHDGSRLLIVTSVPGGGRQLVGLDLGATGANVSFPIGPPVVGEVGSVAGGPGGLRLLACRAAGELLVAGGIEQRRAIVAFDPSVASATVAPAFEPGLRHGSIWRINAARTAGEELFATVEGLEGSFLWNSGDMPGGGSAFLRALARDDEFGGASAGFVPKNVRTYSDPLLLGDMSSNHFSVGTADLDGDGDLDLVSANGDGDNLTGFFQLSPGSFEAIPSLTLGGLDSPRSVKAADLDGDGDQDLVSANVRGNNLTIFFQGSPGSFDAPPLFLGAPETTNRPVSVAAADLDGDGYQDLVSANAGDLETGDGNSLTVFFQDDPGRFSTTPGVALGGPGTTLSPVSVAAADLDGDGDLDLVSANSLLSEFGVGSDQAANNLTVFFQDDLVPGSFASGPRVGGWPTTRFPVSVAAADLDGDGDLDLVSANADGDNLTAFLQDSPGSFGSSPLRLQGSVRPVSVAVADLDADGDQDLVSANLNGANLTTFFQLSPGSFGAPRALGGSATTSGPIAVVAADLYGDGGQDLVSANRDGVNLTVFFQLSPGSFVSPPLVVYGAGRLAGPSSVAASDLDGDGDQDLVSANHNGNNLTIFSQLTPGSFTALPLVLGGFFTTHTPVSVVSADLDGDGDQDLVSANKGNVDCICENLTIFFQDDSLPGSFGAGRTLGNSLTTHRPVSVAAADLDGDGDLDLVSANAGDNTGDGSSLTLFFQDGLLPGRFETTPGVVLGGPKTTHRPVSVAAADLDGDGDLDLVSANAGDINTGDGSSLTLFFQRSGEFEDRPSLILDVSGPSWVTAADMDGDGDQDLVSANGGSNNLTVFFQLSPGVFAVPPLPLGGHGTTDYPHRVVATDLDGDGDLDLVSANKDGDNLTGFFQLSPGSFEAIPSLTLGGLDSPHSVAAVDLDGDGDQDLVSANLEGHNLTVFFGSR